MTKGFIQQSSLNTAWFKPNTECS